ncbi:MAG: DUF3990 domain-containing protein [Lachnospiraceae bacterium]|nr:DUF3990 domain-containing protein [Lachnospiraceae bacterium]
MNLTLYHGSEYIIETPQYGKGSRNNDYGQGFYCTEAIELAKEWACSRNEDGYANIYQLETDGLRILHLNDGKYNILNWLALLAENRTYWEKNTVSEDAKKYLKNNFLIDLTGYDIIIGYRANDSYFSFAQSFVANTLSLRQLSEAMRLGRLGEQTVLKSQKAFSRIHFTDAQKADRETCFSRKMDRDREARRTYRRQVRRQTNTNDLFMLDIMREGIKNGDARLFL